MYLKDMRWNVFLKQLLKDFRYSTYKLEKVHGIKSATISKIITGKTEAPGQETIQDLEKAFDIKIDDSDPENISYTKLNKPETPSTFEGALSVKSYPLLGYVYAGEPEMLEHTTVNEHTEFYYEKPNHRCFALRVNGDSMETTLKDGDIVLVDMDVEPQTGDLVAVKLKDGSQYIKRFKDLNYTFIQLLSDNDKYGDRLVDKNDIVAIYKVVKGHVNF